VAGGGLYVEFLESSEIQRLSFISLEVDKTARCLMSCIQQKSKSQEVDEKSNETAL